MKLIARISSFLAMLAFALAPLTPAVAYAEGLQLNTAANVKALGIHANAVSTTTIRLRPATTTDGGARIQLQEKRAANQASTTAAKEDKAKGKSDTEIDSRITALQQFSARLAGEKLLPVDALATLQASITIQINALNTLKAQIDSDTSTTTLKGDASSITKAYRIYLLVLPQDKITSGADRVLAVASQMQALSAKFADRISAAGSVDATVSGAKTDYDAMVADAQVKANAAVSAVAGLQPDNGDASVRASNDAALKAAMADLRAAQSDLRTARQNAAVIVQGLKGKPGASGSVTASTTNS